MRVLVAEDHERLARAVATGLRRYGMVVDVALTGDDAFARLGATAMTSWCWTGIFLALMATTSVAPLLRSDARAGC